jgi:hypothetical protein
LSALRLDLKPSPTLAAAIVALHAAAALSVLSVLPGAGGFLLAGALLALGALAAWSRALLRSKGSVRTLEIGATGVALHLGAGQIREAEVADRRFVNRFMVVLPIRRPLRRTLLVTRDMLGRESFRALRVWALWRKLPVARKQLPV